jgi:hypothetical protein
VTNETLADEENEFEKPCEGPLDGCLYISEQFVSEAHAQAIESIVRNKG